jgi:4-hydroxy-4-methyl-2-oxoglutarate aldolase
LAPNHHPSIHAEAVLGAPNSRVHAPQAYFRRVGRGIRPGRNEIESVNRPITVGGVLVKPGDVIVADGDGVLVVPRDKAVTVAGYARKILENDKAARRNLYRELGLPDDASVK